MALSTDVVVTGDRIEFPTRCVVCGSDTQDEFVDLRGNPVGLNGIVPWLLRRTKTLRIPAHGPCASKLSRAILFRNLSLVIFATTGLILALWFGLPKWQGIGLVVAATIAPIVWQVIRPLSFEFTHRSGQYKLMFADKVFAREVADLNGGLIEDDEDDEDQKSESGR